MSQKGQRLLFTLCRVVVKAPRLEADWLHVTILSLFSMKRKLNTNTRLTGVLSLHQTVQEIVWSNTKPQSNPHFYSLKHPLRMGKINQMLHCDWLPEEERYRYPARSGLPAVFLQENIITDGMRSRQLECSMFSHARFCPFTDRHITVHDIQ